jgi:hypothetical protein
MSVLLYYISNTETVSGGCKMDMIRRIEPRDWVIAIVAFVAGAWIF